MNLLVISSSVYICLSVVAVLIIIMTWSIYKVMAMDDYANLYPATGRKPYRERNLNKSKRTRAGLVEAGGEISPP